VAWPTPLDFFNVPCSGRGGARRQFDEKGLAIDERRFHCHIMCFPTLALFVDRQLGKSLQKATIKAGEIRP
jgi:hypothetical protein